MSSSENRDRQRAAERAAARFLGEEEADDGRESAADGGDRRVFAFQLFIDGLLQSWGKGGAAETASTRERRVSRALAALGEPAPLRRTNHRAWYAIAACLIISGLIAALWFFPRGGGPTGPDPVRDTIEETLVRIDGELDAVYEGVFAYEFNGHPGEDTLRLVSGPTRHRVDWEMMIGDLSWGAAHGRRWFIPPGASEAIDTTEHLAGMRGGMLRRMQSMAQLDWLQDVGGLLRQIRSHYRIEEKPAADGLIRIRATPRDEEKTADDGARRLRRFIESLDLTIRQATFRVESIAVTMVRHDNLPMMFPIAVGVRLDFVKAYHAPPELFWPTELGAPPATAVRESDR